MFTLLRCVLCAVCTVLLGVAGAGVSSTVAVVLTDVHTVLVGDLLFDTGIELLELLDLCPVRNFNGLVGDLGVVGVLAVGVEGNLGIGDVALDRFSLGDGAGEMAPDRFEAAPNLFAKELTSPLVPSADGLTCIKKSSYLF